MKICEKCALPIRFRKSRHGAWYPVNMDGSFHRCIREAPRDQQDPQNPFEPASRPKPRHFQEDTACGAGCGLEPMGCSSCGRR